MRTDLFYRNIIIILVMITGVVFSASAQKNRNKKNKYINEDSTDIFSTNASRPFKYGYALNREDALKDFEEYREGFNIKNGEVVAEVGAASGWVQGAVSLTLDSVKFYIQDIDTILLNKYQLSKMVEHYSKIRTSPQTNEFVCVIGSEKKTNLPENTFDKIILNNTFHEIIAAQEVLHDLSTKIKPGGKIIIHEVYENENMKVRHGGCNIPAYSVEDIRVMMEQEGLYLTWMKYPEYTIDNYLVFEKDKDKSAAFFAKNQTVEQHLKEFNKLTDKDLCKDSASVAKIIAYLKTNLESIHAVYPSLEPCFNSLAYQYSKRKLYTQEVNVTHAWAVLYPKSFDALSCLGYAYSEAGNYQKSIEVFYRTLKIKPNDVETYLEIADIKYEMEDYENAITDYQKALELTTTNDSAVILADIGYCYQDMKEEATATEYFTRAIKTDPKNPEYYCARGTVNYDDSLLEDALADYEMAIKLDSGYWEAWEGRSLVKYALGDKAGYKADWAKAKELRKNSKKKKS